jgi:translation initiation factor 2B subunit (eIF-2B alpha/beta/delta family)
MENFELAALIAPLKDDLLSGAAEIALRAITVFQTVMKEAEGESVEELKGRLTKTARALVQAQPAMAPVFQLGNMVLKSIDAETNFNGVQAAVNKSLAIFEHRLCASAAAIADFAYDLVPAGGLIFAYSFSSTVVSCLLSARSKGRYFRVACTEARPAMEGRKLASVLAAGNIEVIHTFDNALGLVLPNCSAAFMGCDCIGRPGVVNKVGSWATAVACRELGIPVYALAGTEKIVTDDRFFEFENHERPDLEVWEKVPKGVRVLNHQFEVVPFSLLGGVITEQGILQEKDIENLVAQVSEHEALKLRPANF